MTQDPAGLQEPFWRLAPAAGQVAATDVGTAGLRPQPPLLRTGRGTGLWPHGARDLGRAARGQPAKPARRAGLALLAPGTVQKDSGPRESPI